MASTYPFDPTGLAATNLVRQEEHVITERNDNTYRLIVPKFPPFYLDDLSLVSVQQDGSRLPLTHGSDYTAVLPYLGASRSLRKMVYGGISLHTSIVQGTVEMDYRTLGGEWVADRNYILEQLFIKLYNPRVVAFDQVTNVQQTFPPVDHEEPVDNFYFSQRDLLDKFDEIIAAILSKSATDPIARLHYTAVGNVHELKPEDINLGNVPNIPLASDADLLDLVAADKLVSLKQMIDSKLVERLAGVQGLKEQITLMRQRAVSDAIESIKGIINADYVGLGSVQNLPVATNTEVLDLMPSRKYITLEQAIMLFSLLKNQP